MSVTLDSLLFLPWSWSDRGDLEARAICLSGSDGEETGTGTSNGTSAVIGIACGALINDRAEGKAEERKSDKGLHDGV